MVILFYPRAVRLPGAQLSAHVAGQQPPERFRQRRPSLVAGQNGSGTNRCADVREGDHVSDHETHNASVWT
jgi:hypothetical protein